MAASRIDVFRQMLETDPDNTMVRFGLANEYLKAEQWPEAIAALEAYIAKADDEGAAYGMMARAHERLGQREQARACYVQGIAVSQAHGHPSMAADYQMTLESDYNDD
jgi:predicted Zn-dependent protease